MSMRRIRILVVDDSRVNRMMMTSILETAGYRLDEAGSGREAVEGVQFLPYDMVLMDIQMPEMDGIEATRRIRALPEPKGAVPVIGITGEIDDAAIALARDAGMNACLTKPVDHDALMRMIENLTRSESSGEKTEPAEAGVASPALGGLAAHYTGAERARLVDAFLQEAEMRRGEIERAVASGSWNAAGRAAHSLGGCAANIGLETLGQRAAAIESACGRGGTAEMPSLMSALAEAMRSAVAALAPLGSGRV
jgi:two-component system sensor histidine kinase/response regulator